MKIVILPSARDDLAGGAAFYENQGEGLGEYFRESLISDVDSWKYTRAFTKECSDFTACCLSTFHTQFITRPTKTRSLSGPSLTAGEIPKY